MFAQIFLPAIFLPTCSVLHSGKNMIGKKMMTSLTDQATFFSARSRKKQFGGRTS